MPEQASDLKLDHRELTFGDYTKLVLGWMKKNLLDPKRKYDTP